MIEVIDNGIQLLMTFVCTAVAVYQAIRSRSKVWVLIALFSGVFFLGVLYWLLYGIFYGEAPISTLITDISWYASFLFLFLLLLQLGEGKKKVRSKALWFIPLFAAAMCAYYMQWGAYVSNIIYAFLLTLILWQAFGGLLSVKKDPQEQYRRPVYRMAIVFSALEYCIWTASCIWEGYTFANPYYWFDILLSLSFVFFLPAVRKAVDR